MTSLPASAVVREVEPRDGLHSIATVLATAHKKDWAALERVAGETLHGTLWRVGLPTTFGAARIGTTAEGVAA